MGLTQDTRSLLDITDRSVRMVAHKIARLEITRLGPVAFDRESVRTLVAVTRGDYTLEVALRAGPELLRAIAESMRRGPVDDEGQVAEYVTEFFNILFGNVVSEFNRHSRASARFGLPRVVREGHGTGPVPQRGESPHSLYYDSPYGPMQVRASFLQ